MNSAPHSQLWIALRFHRLPLNSLGLNEHSPASLVFDEKIVVSANSLAAKLGVRVGMSLAKAQMLGECTSHKRQPLLERQALEQLCQGLYQFTPYIQIFELADQSGLLLEVSRCLKLFQGIVKLKEKLCAFLTSSHYEYRIGYAHSPKGAWLLSFEGHEIDGNESIDLFKNRLRTVSINQLQGQGKAYDIAIDTLLKSGFHCLGDIIKQVEHSGAHSLNKRFGEAFIGDVCNIFGTDSSFLQNDLFAKPVPTFKPEELFSESLSFDYPIANTEHLLPAMQSLLDKLGDYLRNRQLETQDIEWHFFDIHHKQETLVLKADYAQTQCDFFYELSRIKLENQPLPFEVDGIELVCKSTSELKGRRQCLNFESERPSHKEEKDLYLLGAKLKTRLGEKSIFKLSFADDHAPELSFKKISLSEKPKQALNQIQEQAIRPEWLFNPPQKIQQRQKALYWHGSLSIISGPERLETHWWDKPIARDYFFARREDETCFWIFWDALKSHWYVHGVFA